MNFYITILILSAIIIVFLMIKKMKPLKMILSVLSGIAALLACDLIFSLYGGNMPINIYTLLFSSVGGIPGVILLILLKTFII